MNTRLIRPSTASVPRSRAIRTSRISSRPFGVSVTNSARESELFKTLSAKLAGAQAIVFFALGVGFILATERMFEGRRLLELATDLGIGVVAFPLLAALLVFNFLTRRLRALALAVDRFRDRGFTEPIHLTSANPRGDDIDRLGAAVQEMSERIAEQLDLLGQTDVRRRELLANVSHDLRTPLASMQIVR